MKDKNGITITKAFRKIFDESNRKPNKIWVDQGSEFIRTLKNKIWKYMTSVSKNVYIDKLDDIVKVRLSDSHLPKKNFLFVSMIALQK